MSGTMTLESQMIIIFGGTGDLTRRKLIPALYHLEAKKRLTDCTPILCIGRREMAREQFLQLLTPEKYINDIDELVLANLLDRIDYLAFDSGKGTADQFAGLIQERERCHGCTGNKLIYLALPTTAFSQTAVLIGALNYGTGWRRVVFEKPFGQDLATARKLNEQISSVLDEKEIYRVDHYLGKELVQNILALRFGNEIFSAIWNRKTIDHVQITVAESLGVEKRAGYYDKSGAVRDMVQNHLLQLFSFVAMEPPVDGSPDALRDSAAAVLAALRMPTGDDVVLGQYDVGRVEGQDVPGYRDEEGVDDHSRTETYGAMRLHVDTDRWRGVPFYLRTGKRLSGRFAEIHLFCKRHESPFFPDAKPNVITVRIQPDEGIALSFNVRNPGQSGETSRVLMDFCHHCHFGPNTPEAYESILYRVMKGDHAIFPRWDWIEASWRWVDEIYKVASGVVPYSAGSHGPTDADFLLVTDNRKWLDSEPVNRIIPVVTVPS